MNDFVLYQYIIAPINTKKFTVNCELKLIVLPLKPILDYTRCLNNIPLKVNPIGVKIPKSTVSHFGITFCVKYKLWSPSIALDIIVMTERFSETVGASESPTSDIKTTLNKKKAVAIAWFKPSFCL